jgi:hypothetical protein
MQPDPHPDGPPPSPQQAHFDFADLSEELLLRLEQEQYEREQQKSDIDFWDDVAQRPDEDFHEELGQWDPQLYLELSDIA